MSDRLFSVYLARCADGTVYCGITTDILRRCMQHNGLIAGGARYTSRRRPVVMLSYSGYLFTRSKATSIEYRVKRCRHSLKAAKLQKEIQKYEEDRRSADPADSGGEA